MTWPIRWISSKAGKPIGLPMGANNFHGMCGWSHSKIPRNLDHFICEDIYTAVLRLTGSKVRKAIADALDVLNQLTGFSSTFYSFHKPYCWQQAGCWLLWLVTSLWLRLHTSAPTSQAGCPPRAMYLVPTQLIPVYLLKLPYLNKNS